MYLESVRISNFRKFGKENNRIEFVDSRSIQDLTEGDILNIAPTTTLIVGKNNSGKTTIITSLEKLLKGNSFCAHDFNYGFLKDALNTYIDSGAIIVPFIEFVITIGLEDRATDLITNLVPFMDLNNVYQSELVIVARYEIANDELFKEDVTETISRDEMIDQFAKYLGIIEESTFKINYYDSNGEIVENFKIDSLMQLKPIKANKVENDFCLSKAFSKIIEYRYKSLVESGTLQTKINQINSELTGIIEKTHTSDINKSLSKIESAERLKVLLKSDLTFKKLLNNLIKYEYIEKNNNIPENQFGLGYTNLMMIIAELIDYMEKYPTKSFNSKVNLISIEEPETYMHPQMQEQFIKNINEAITTLLDNKEKNLNSQIIITTHSSNILNSKIQSGNTFNNINYVTTLDSKSNVVNLNDDSICPEDGDTKEQLKFLKKHIKYKVSELFFADAIIFVEGVTEETILRYCLDNEPEMSKYYISIFNINGAHGLVYHKLIRELKIPSLIVTDLDIKRSKQEKETFEQITSLEGRSTTNATICKYLGNSNQINNIKSHINEDNIYITYQDEIHGYYPTSFEESFILTNYNCDVLNESLKTLKPNLYKNIVGDKCNRKNLKSKSYMLQKKLSNSKSNFANTLLFEYLTLKSGPSVPILPDYIENGLEWLKKELKGEK